MGNGPQTRCFCAPWAGRAEGDFMSGLACVNDAELRAFLLGELPEPIAQAVSAHLESCPDCEAAARRLDELTDPIIRDLRQKLASPTGNDQTALCPTLDTVTPPPPAASAGLPRRVAGYEILEQIGRGGMSVVYKARQ